jgi:hypothetical protein
MQAVEVFLQAFVRWAERQWEIEAVALVGSWARGEARPGSDIDLVLVVADPATYLNDDAWLRQFGTLRAVWREDWGLVQSRRALYEDGSEVEFGLTTLEWLATDRLDAGTAAVIRGGVRVLLDRTGNLGRLIAAVRSE